MTAFRELLATLYVEFDFVKWDFVVMDGVGPIQPMAKRAGIIVHHVQRVRRDKNPPPLLTQP